MPELSSSDLEQYTGDRLDGSDAGVLAMLNAAVAIARRECRWHVCPVRTDVTMTLDGPGSRVLFLPTQKVVELTSVTEDGTLLDLDTIKSSAGDGDEYRRRVALRKTGRGWWTDEYGGLEIVLSHGYTEAEAVDWRQGVLAMVDQMSLLPVSGGSGTSPFGIKSERIDDVAYTYDSYAAMAEEVLFTSAHIFENYKLPDVEFF